MKTEENYKKYYKLKLCRNYEKDGKCDKGNNCTYAHGDNELKEIKKEECFNGLNCFKKSCQFNHPKGWNHKNNIKICEFFRKGYCNKEDKCKFKHVIEEKDENEDPKIKENGNNESININDNNDFPYLKENIISDKTNDVLECIYNIKENCNIDEIESKNKDNVPNVEVLVNGIKYNEENIFNEKVIDNTENLIDELQNNILELSKKIKENIDKEFTEYKEKYGINMKIELNEMISEISLFKNNYKDIMDLN